MANIVAYEILKGLKLRIELFSGKIFYHDLINLINSEFQDKDYDPALNTLVVLSNAKFSLSHQEIDQFVCDYKNNNNYIGYRKVAILTNTPNQVVISTLYDNAINNLPMSQKIVSTMEAALHWLGISLKHEQVILDTIEKITNNAV